MASGERLNLAENQVSVGKRFDFLEFLAYVRFKIAWLIIPVAVCTIAMAVYVYAIAVPMYEGTAQIYVVNSKDSVINLSDLQLGTYLTSDYQYAFQTWEVNQMVINNLDLPYTVESIRKRLTIENPSNTRILQIKFLSKDPKEAAAVANEYAEVASTYIAELMLTAKPTIISTALEPVKPAQPRKMLLMGAAAVLSGLAVAWGLFLAFLLDDKIKTSADLKRLTNVEPLAVIPRSQTMGAGQKKGR